MTLNISAPVADAELKPRILVIGVGGAGGNAVNNMIRSNLEGVEFIVCNTDAQALKHSQADRKIQLGASITQGLGAGARPDVGRAAAEETLEEVLEQIEGANMLFVTAGMGGGTGTGAAPVLARAARERGILTVGVVTKPFQFEGSQRMKLADAGIEELQQYVDTLIIIPNQNLFRVANEKTTFADAFKMADDVLYSGVRGVTDLMIMPGLINLDFADIRTVMSEMGKAMMGTGEADGDNRAILAAEAAISNPLLEDVTMRGARGVLINITGGADMTLFEVDEAANRIREEVDPEANIIFGSTFDESLEGIMRVSVVATGIEADMASAHRPMPLGLTRAQARLQEKRVEEPTITATVEHPTEPVADNIEPADEAETGIAAASLFEGMGIEATAHHADAPAADAEHVEEEIFETVESASEQEEDHSLGGIPGFLTENTAEGVDHGGKVMEASAPVRTPDVVPPRDAFIPPRPVKPEDIAEGGQASQAAETASGDHASTGSTARQSDGDTRPKRTLFERMTKLGFGSSEPKAETAPKQPTLRAPEQASAPAAPAPQHRPATGSAAAAVKVEDSQPMLGSAEPAEQPAQQAEDELLEIPAFLRRQVN